MARGRIATVRWFMAEERRIVELIEVTIPNNRSTRHSAGSRGARVKQELEVHDTARAAEAPV